MNTLGVILVALGAWCALSVPVAIVRGKIIARAECDARTQQHNPNHAPQQHATPQHGTPLPRNSYNR